jgi:bacillithiol system protein YtxJ
VDARVSPVLTLGTMDDLEALLAQAQQRPVLLLKHSTRCPVSAMAYRAFAAAAQAGELAGVQPAVVRVIEQRAISQEVAVRLGVAHASPQALLIAGGAVRWQASHYDITREALRAAAAAAAPPGSPSGGPAVPGPLA